MTAVPVKKARAPGAGASPPPLVVGGYGISMHVRRGHLEIVSGIADQRTTTRLSRLDVPRRVTVIGQTGAISVEALRWLRDAGSSYVQLDADGQLIAAGGARTTNDPRIRRAQALAAYHPAGVDAARVLIRTKVAGQRDNLGKVPQSRTARALLSDAIVEIDRAASIATLRHLESRAAAEYWDCLRLLPVTFIPRDESHVPAHWRLFGPRASRLSDSPRKATTPAHALLNYAYAVLEAEARLAALAVGCDPGIGVIHTDNARRDSFACDLMEAVRPAVDAYIMHLLETRTFLRSDFFETREGVCRVAPTFATAISGTAPEWARLIAPVAEELATSFRAMAGDIGTGALTLGALGRGAARDTLARPLRTPLTRRNRSRASREKSDADAGLSAALSLPLPRRCKECGVEITARRRLLCDACLATMPARASRKAQAVLRQLRAIGEDRRSANDVCERKRRAAAEQMRAIAEWEATHAVPADLAVFQREILPIVRQSTIAAVAEATGLSRVMCSKIRRGVQTPHPRHWDAIRGLAKRN